MLLCKHQPWNYSFILYHVLPRQALITIYKAFISPYLDNRNIPYDKALNVLFHQKIE